MTITSSDKLKVKEILRVSVTTTATGGRGGAITFMVSNGSGRAIVDSKTGVLIGKRAGTVMLIAIYAGDLNYTMSVASQLITIKERRSTEVIADADVSTPKERSDADQKIIMPKALSPRSR